jgi:hypothetical protein
LGSRRAVYTVGIRKIGGKSGIFKEAIGDPSIFGSFAAGGGINIRK